MWSKLPVKLAAFITKVMCYSEYSRFQRSLVRPEEAQSELLRKFIRDLACTEYGKHYGVCGDEDYSAFASKLPIHSYADMEPWVTQQLVTQQSIITPHSIIHVEPTSGSSGSMKNIPYTQPLLRSFSNMLRVWVYDLLHHRLKLETGRIFISVSPPTDKGGFTDDRAYLSGLMRTIFSLSLVMPPKSDAPNFLHNLALTLLREEKLEVISIWSPSYLLALLEYIFINRDTLVEGLSDSQRNVLLTSPINWKGVWPHLKMLSCWDNALAEPLVGQLQKIFPHVWIQGKGLLATEAPITVPLATSRGCLPLLGEVFLEFEAVGGEIKRIHELQDGQHYQLIITQSAGLTRYRMHDLVEVQGFYKNTPCLVFIGRSQICDMVGEKLNEIFVRQALLPLFPTVKFLLVPWQNDGQGYVLLVDDPISDGLTERAEASLCQAHHYALARHIGQLAPLRVQHIPALSLQLRSFHQQRGMKIGDIKDTVLITNLVQAEQLLTYCSNNQIVEAA
ncbi:MAG: GH3 auxin-responsive promoter family protein [Burkholderiales bacterium]|jgi:hypothetical protein|nr:GH3 auxin-responsive promoter family protein [Microcystis sp. M020S1]MCA3176317.1 GH3 auxin-responsive promoter family protein [Burkholderiales bacterium]